MGGAAKRVFELGGGWFYRPPPSSRWSLGGATQVILMFYCRYLNTYKNWFFSQKVGNQDKVLFRKPFEFNALGLRHV